MPTPSNPGGTPKKRVNYNYSWPVPARKPKAEPKKSASNGKLGGKHASRIQRTTV